MKDERKENAERWYAKRVWMALCELQKVVYEANKAGVNIGAASELDLHNLIREVSKKAGMKHDGARAVLAKIDGAKDVEFEVEAVVF